MREWIPEDEFQKMLAEERQARRLGLIAWFDDQELPESMKEIIEKEKRLKQEPEAHTDGGVKPKDKYIGNGPPAHVKYMFINGEEVPVKVATLK